MPQVTHSAEIEQIFEEYLQERNNVPGFVRLLADEAPDFLVKMIEARRIVRGGPAIPAKYRELMIVVGAATRMAEGSVQVHSRLALNSGVTKQEYLEAALCAWLIGGMPSLTACLSALETWLAEEAGGSVTA